MNERQLIARVLTGDAVAEKALYQAHVDRIYRLAYRMTGDETMAEDCTQETFLKAFAKLSEFEGRSALSTWLHAITVSTVLNSLRKVTRLRQRETELSEARVSTMSTPSADPVLKMWLHDAIDRLAYELRLVFLMHDVEGYKHHEIADILQVPVGTSKTRLHRARQLLRQDLAPGNTATAREE